VEIAVEDLDLGRALDVTGGELGGEVIEPTFAATTVMLRMRSPPSITTFCRVRAPGARGLMK